MSWESAMGDKVTLLVGDCPVGLEFGIDCISYETGSKFKGVTAIPPGVHLIYYSQGQFQREAYFCHLVQPVHVLGWDKTSERMVLSELTREQCALHQREVLSGQLNSNLAPYPLKHYQSWVRLTTFLRVSTLRRCNCAPHELLVPEHPDAAPANQAPLEGNVAVFAPLQQLEAQGLQTYHADGATLTAMAMDRSWLLETLTQRLDGSSDEVLGELQLAFLLFLFLHSPGALAHWKLLLTLLCESAAHLLQHPAFAQALVQVLYAQIKYVPDDFFEDHALAADNFLAHAVQALFSCLHTSRDVEVIEHRTRLAHYLQKKFGWSRLADGQAIDLVVDGEDLGAADDSARAIVGPEVEDDGEDDGKETWGAARRRSEPAPAPTPSPLFADKAHLLASSLDALQYTQQQYLPPGMKLPPNLGDLLAIAMDTEEPQNAEPVELPPIAPQDREAARFGWRYPLLHAAMMASAGAEDMIMAAMRVLDSGGASDQLVNECVAFIENEAARLV